ncbi:hypothetical protein PF041_24850, partial [Enterobacter hormaechei subsp. xiangfangensis]|nr:hypothetical protein [Enterobacter hormaechei subsp. xiangfangensis]
LCIVLASPRKVLIQPKARPARRRRTTERSESVSEEAESSLYHIFSCRVFFHILRLSYVA